MRVTYGVTRIFGTGALGPVVVSVAFVLALAYMFGRRVLAGNTLTADA